MRVFGVLNKDSVICSYFNGINELRLRVCSVERSVSHVTLTNALFCNLCVLWCQFPEDSETITPKHVGEMYKIVRINYRIVHLLVLCELLTLS